MKSIPRNHTISLSTEDNDLRNDLEYDPIDPCWGQKLSWEIIVKEKGVFQINAKEGEVTPLAPHPLLLMYIDL